jgi:hypothetical protein
MPKIVEYTMFDSVNCGDISTEFIPLGYSIAHKVPQVNAQ